MISFKTIKRSTLLVVLSVIALSLLTMNVTYSYVFSVKSSTNVQTFTAGTLEVSVSGSKEMSAKTLMPAEASAYPTNANSKPNDDNNNSFATLTLNNSGSLDASFSVSLSKDTAALPAGKSASDCIDMQYLRIGIYDVSNSKWVSLGNGIYSALVSSISSTNGVYPIINDTVTSKKSRSYKIYIWLSESTPVTEIGKLVYLKLNVKSTPTGQA